MKSKDVKLVKSILGEDVFDELKKSSIYKPETRTALQPEEIRVALEIVPRSVLAFLFSNLKYRAVNDIIEVELPWALNTKLRTNKLGMDNYSGEIIQEGKKIYEFQHRSMPSLGLVLLSLFELYDVDLLNEIKQQKPEENKHSEHMERLQDVIDSRLAMHNLVRDVVDKRISEREAISKLIKERLSDHIAEVQSSYEAPQAPVEVSSKSKLRQFLESREKKRSEPVEMDKSENVKCPDCKTVIYKKEAAEIVPCLCFGQHFNKAIKITKSEDGKVKIKFPKNFETDNVEMLLSALKNRGVNEKK